jgi:uncharacterized membrane protein (DUF485 family)
MALSPDERRFIKNWQDQRKDGKASFVGAYTFGLFILFYMSFIAVGLFGGWPFLKVSWLLIMGIAAFFAAFLFSNLLWRMNQKKFSRIIQREMAAGKAQSFNQ